MSWVFEYLMGVFVSIAHAILEYLMGVFVPIANAILTYKHQQKGQKLHLAVPPHVDILFCLLPKDFTDDEYKQFR